MFTITRERIMMQFSGILQLSLLSEMLTPFRYSNKHQNVLPRFQELKICTLKILGTINGFVSCF